MNKKILRQQVASLGTVLALGVPGYLAFFSAGRGLDPDDFATFVAFWSLTNTALLGIFAPIESQGPFLRTQDSKGFFSVIRGLTSTGIVIATIMMLIGQAVFTPNLEFGVLLSIACVFSYSHFNFIRTEYFATHQLFNVFLNSLIFLLIFAFSLFLAILLLPSRAWSYLACLPIAWLGTALISRMIIRIRTFGKIASSGTTRNLLKEFKPSFDKNYLAITAASFISFLPQSAGLLLAKENLPLHQVFTSYVGTVMLTRLGLTLVNSVTPIFALAYNRNNANRSLYRTFLRLHLGVFLVSAFIAIGIFYFFGQTLLGIFINSELHLSISEIALVVFGECVLAATVASKTQLVARGIWKSQIGPWSLSTVIYFLVATTFSGVVGFALAGISAGAMVIFLQFRQLRNSMQ